MIVRIQQFQLIDAERFAAWPLDPSDGATGAIRAPFPAGMNAYELSVLEHDEHGDAVPMERRRAHLRALLSPLADTLREAGSSIVIRLDGPLAPGELLAAFAHLTDARGGGRFAISATAKLDAAPAAAEDGSVRIEAAGKALAAICGDARLGIDRGVRLRVFCVPEQMVNPLLDVAELDDERWPEILSATHFMMQNTHGLDALHVITRLEAEPFSMRISGQLDGGGN